MLCVMIARWFDSLCASRPLVSVIMYATRPNGCAPRAENGPP